MSYTIINNLNAEWVDQSNMYYRAIKRYIEENDGELKRKSIEIKIKKYKHIPMLHGILINEEHLFLSHTTWDERDQITGALNYYTYYNSDSDVGRLNVDMFKNWIERILKN